MHTNHSCKTFRKTHVVSSVMPSKQNLTYWIFQRSHSVYAPEKSARGKFWLMRACNEKTKIRQMAIDFEKEKMEMSRKEKKPIAGRVIRILDEFSVILSVGLKDNVQNGMKFVIYEEGEEIQDPETNTSLGKIEFVKAVVEITHVQDNLSIARSAEFYPTTTMQELSQTLAEVSLLKGARKELPVDSSEIRKLETMDKKIKVGDKAKLIQSK